MELQNTDYIHWLYVSVGGSETLNLLDEYNLILLSYMTLSQTPAPSHIITVKHSSSFVFVF